MSDQFDFSGDVVIVTGAGGGMGRAHALELARRGARVVVNDLGGSPFGGGSDEGLAHAVVEEIRSFGGEAIANTASIATPEGGASLVDDAIKKWGRVDALVANAAIAHTTPFADLSVEEFDSVVNVNLRGVFLVAQPTFKAMRDSGGGRIVVVNSLSGMLGATDQTAYAASKAGLVGLVRTVAIEGAAHGILANTVAPSAFGTRMAEAIIERRSSEANGGASAPLRVISEEVYRRRAPELVTPIIVRLAHRSCPSTGEMFWAWAGAFGRATVTLNEGWHSDEPPVVGDLVAHWDEIISHDTARDAVPNSHAFMAGELQRLFASSS